MKQKQLIFKAGCALVLCASLALPGALAAWDDFQLLHTPSVRPQADGALSYQARELHTRCTADGSCSVHRHWNSLPSRARLHRF